MPMIRIMPILALIMLAGCVGGSPQDPGIHGPTGRASDAGKVDRDRGQGCLETGPDSPGRRRLVTTKLPSRKTATLRRQVRFDGYYDSARRCDRVGVYGNVTTNTDYGTVNNNGYYVIWEQNGRDHH